MKFAAFVEYANEPERIAQHRPAHRAYLQDLLQRGRLVIAGPFADGSGALFVYEAANEREAARLAASDPFAKASLFQGIVMKPWKLVFASTDHLTPAL
ncbi:YciI family protein [Cupriavidus sp. WKF15]|uniref:YciI family protein n=1 Tax=Cupriavidus sp. WKF15 TaxID=3032282 RepID=UPI0023E31B59|nr:YciI family protein [Cupriavidus sp. WKF15]WER49472.1 YciI family protein [Cupriavidus sp. WKF15]